MISILIQIMLFEHYLRFVTVDWLFGGIHYKSLNGKFYYYKYPIVSSRLCYTIPSICYMFCKKKEVVFQASFLITNLQLLSIDLYCQVFKCIRNVLYVPAYFVFKIFPGRHICINFIVPNSFPKHIILNFKLIYFANVFFVIAFFILENSFFEFGNLNIVFLQLLISHSDLYCCHSFSIF